MIANMKKQQRVGKNIWKLKLCFSLAQYISVGNLTDSKLNELKLNIIEAPTQPQGTLVQHQTLFYSQAHLHRVDNFRKAYSCTCQSISQ